MCKAYKFRLYPNHTQKELIHKTFGCYRFVYNFSLYKCKTCGYQKAFDMIHELRDLIKALYFPTKLDYNNW